MSNRTGRPPITLDEAGLKILNCKVPADLKLAFALLARAQGYASASAKLRELVAGEVSNNSELLKAAKRLRA